MQLAALHNAVDLPPTNHVINTHRYTLEQLSQDCIVRFWLLNVFALMMTIDYNVLPPHTVLTHWLVV